MFTLKYLILVLLPVLNVTRSMIVNTHLGKIQGNTLETWKGKKFYAFRGIPYAESPTGPLRFKDPKPKLPWNGIFNATIDGPMCPQPDKEFSEMSEDCIRLNVYTHDTTQKPLKPVLLYIPGGGLYVGSGISSDYGGPFYIMEHDIVFISINYRLGTLGFLSYGTPEYPGNAGLKDQVMAMRWVQQNIHHFGGDPERVTLIGNSAGAMSITSHAMSPMSQNLFHQAIIGSGGVNLISLKVTEQINVADKQAKVLGCSELGTLKCLEQSTMEEFVNSTYSMFEAGLVSPWAYGIIEPNFGQDRFFSEDPHKSMEEGRFKKMPILAGWTDKELFAEAYSVVGNPATSESFNQNYEYLLPLFFNYEQGTEQSKNISNNLRNFYGLDKNLTKNDIDAFNNLLSDGSIRFGVEQFMKFMYPFKNVYAYEFSYIGRYSHFYDETKKAIAAVHSDDFIYLFTRNRVAPIFKPSDPEASIVDKITELYTNFVKTGDPNGKTGTLWKKFDPKAPEYLSIGEKLEMRRSVYTERIELWDSLFPVKYPKSTSFSRFSSSSSSSLLTSFLVPLIVLINFQLF